MRGGVSQIDISMDCR